MNREADLSEATLNAFVDGELDLTEEELVIEAMEADAELHRKVCDLRRLKTLVRHAYAAETAPLRLGRNPWLGRRLGWAAAASMLLALGYGFGIWSAGGAPGAERTPISLQGVASHPNRLLLHLSRSDERDFASLLDQIDRLYADADSAGVQVDVVANAGGLDLLRADGSPYAQRVHAMMQRHPQLTFVACTNAIRRYQERGVQVVLVEDTIDDVTAIERIVSRLREGWTYIAI